MYFGQLDLTDKLLCFHENQILKTSPWKLALKKQVSVNSWNLCDFWSVFLTDQKAVFFEKFWSFFEILEKKTSFWFFHIYNISQDLNFQVFSKSCLFKVVNFRQKFEFAMNKAWPLFDYTYFDAFRLKTDIMIKLVRILIA